MALVACISARSPGLTTAVQALAATWPAPRRAIVAELDPAGGVISARHAFPDDPGLLSLAADANYGLTSEHVLGNVRRLASGILAIPAPPSPDRAVASLETLHRVGLGAALAALPGFDVLADCGRIDSRSPALPILDAADLVVCVVGARREDVLGMRYRLQSLQSVQHTHRRLPAMLITVGTIRERGEIITALGADIAPRHAGYLSWDTKGAAALGEGVAKERSQLLRSAGRVAAVLVEALPGYEPAPVAQPEPAPPSTTPGAAWNQPSPTRWPFATPPSPHGPESWSPSR